MNSKITASRIAGWVGDLRGSGKYGVRYRAWKQLVLALNLMRGAIPVSEGMLVGDILSLVGNCESLEDFKAQFEREEPVIHASLMESEERKDPDDKTDANPSDDQSDDGVTDGVESPLSLARDPFGILGNDGSRRVILYRGPMADVHVLVPQGMTEFYARVVQGSEGGVEYQAKAVMPNHGVWETYGLLTGTPPVGEFEAFGHQGSCNYGVEESDKEVPNVGDDAGAADKDGDSTPIF